MILKPTIVEDSVDPPLSLLHTHTHTQQWTQQFALHLCCVLSAQKITWQSGGATDRTSVCLLKNKITAIDGIYLSSQIRLVNVMLAEVQAQQRPSFHCL